MRIPGYAVVKTEVNKLVPMGLDQDAIYNNLRNRLLSGLDLSTQDEVTIKAYIDQACKEHSSFAEIQEIVNGILLAPHDGKDSYILINRTTRKKRVIKTNICRAIFSPKFDLKPLIKPCYMTYNPHENRDVYEKEGITYYNTYVPPKWMHDNFYFQKPIPVNETMPEIYERFFAHVFNNDKASIDYVIKWLANSLRARNFCYLTTIGEQGVGKGLLGEIMESLQGESNYSCVNYSNVKDKKFNSIFINKRIIYLDEIRIKNKEQEDSIKSFANNTLEAEFKGVDSKMVDNYASIYCSSNRLDALRISSDDRRFSIVNLTKTPLRSVMSVEEIISLRDANNIEKLAQYLYHYKFDTQEMLNPFQSERSREVKGAAITDIEDYILNQWCKLNASKTVPLNEFQDHVVEKFGSKYRPSGPFLIELNSRFSGYFELLRPRNADGTRPRIIKVNDLAAQPDNFFDVDEE